MRKRNGKLMLAITFVLCAALFAERLTGQMMHAFLGLVVTIVMAVHIGGRWKQLRYQKLSVRIVDGLLAAALLVLLESGIALHPMQEVLALKILHKLSAVLFAAGIIAHVVQHKKQCIHKNPKN